MDRLINCLTGDAIPAGLGMLAQSGRFIELGRAGIWAEEQVRVRRPDIDYTILALDRLITDQPDRVGRGCWPNSSASLARGDLPLIPVQAVSLARLPEAIRELEAARHVGKLVLRRPRFRPDASYLVTGGTGALGQQLVALARDPWCQTRHRRRSPAAGTRGTRCRPAGRVADVADAAAMAHVLARIEPPLKGVFHLAGVLDDGVLAAQTAARFERVLDAKLGGAAILDRLTRPLGLDHFVLFGSLAGIAGAPGQANYAAANAALAGVAQARRAAGSAALLVDWGAWAGAGMAAGRGGATIDPAAAGGVGRVAGGPPDPRRGGCRQRRQRWRPSPPSRLCRTCAPCRRASGATGWPSS